MKTSSLARQAVKVINNDPIPENTKHWQRFAAGIFQEQIPMGPGLFIGLAADGSGQSVVLLITPQCHKWRINSLVQILTEEGWSAPVSASELQQGVAAIWSVSVPAPWTEVITC